MSTCSVEPSNQICYIEKPPKPLGSAINDFIKEQVKTEEANKAPYTADTAAKVGTAASISSASVNGIGQITGQVISTTA